MSRLLRNVHFKIALKNDNLRNIIDAKDGWSIFPEQVNRSS